MKNLKKIFSKEIPIVYTMESCTYCAKVKEDLEKENIKFIEKDIRENDKEWKKKIRITGHPNTPTVVFRGVYLAPMRDFNNPVVLIDILNELKENNLDYQVHTLEKIKTMNYQLAEAFKNLIEIINKKDENIVAEEVAEEASEEN